MGSVRLYLRYLAISIRAQMQYRASVVMVVTGRLLTSSLEFFSVWVLFERFGSIRGWTLPEVALLYGMANVSFAFAEGLARGFSIFDQQVKSGDFDRILLRPRGTAFQVAASQVELARIGRLLQGLAIFGFAVWALPMQWSVARVFLATTAMAGGACTFAGVFVLQATLAFWTVESLELVNTVTYGGVETTQYPLSIYPRSFRRFFTYVIPLAFVGYVPALALLDRTGPIGPPWLAWASPAIGVAFLLVCLRVWRFGVRHYRSTGS